jgi:dihydropteroate synthase
MLMRSSKPVSLNTGRSLVMGIVNCTPDSFYAGSRFSARAAVERGLQMLEEGADWLDIGGQSTRPGSKPISVQEELDRVLPVIEALAKKTEAPLSVDTDKPEVAKAARLAGAAILNDVNGLRAAGMLAEAVEFDKVVIMHMQGTPETMQEKPSYTDLLSEVVGFLTARKEAFINAGGDPAAVMVDPGIGFGKTLEHNLALLNGLKALAKVGPVVLGASRKSFLSKITPDAGPEDRLIGSIAAAVLGASDGVAAVRVHDVKETKAALDVVAAVRGMA